MMRSLSRLLLTASLLLLAMNSYAAHEHAPAEKQTRHEGCDHAHAAPHGGTLIPLGDHVGHVELLLDSEDGTVRLYVLDAHAENPIRITDPKLILDILHIDDKEIQTEALQLQAVASLLTGEEVGNTSEFAAAHSKLVGASHFTGQLRAITLRGVLFEDIAISGGKAAEEHDHEHSHHEHSDHDHSDHDHDH